MFPVAILVFMAAPQDLEPLRAEARAAGDFEADALRGRLFRRIAGDPLAGKLARGNPRIETSGAWEHDAAWTALFLDVAGRTEDGIPPGFARADLERLFVPALRGIAADHELHDVLWEASRKKLMGVVSEITGLLGGPDPDAKKHALLRLGEMGAVESIPAIVPLLGEKDPELRRETLRTLAVLRDPSAGPALRALLSDPDAGIRAAAAETLGGVRDREAPARLVPLLRDPEPQVRKSVLESLAALRARTHAGAIRPLLEDPDASVRSAAVGAARRLVGDSFEAWVRPRLKDRDARVRSAAAEAWGERVPEKGSELLPLLRDPDRSVRNTTLWRLRWARVPEAGREVLRLYRSNPGDADLIAPLGEFRVRDAVPDLLARLEDKEPGPRGYAVEALGAIGAPEAAPALARLLRDPDGQFVTRVSLAIRRLEGPAVAGPLLELLADENVQVRGHAVELLGDRGAREAVPKLLALAPAGNEPIRVGIALALVKLGEKEGLDRLLAYLKHPQPRIRTGAAYALGDLKRREAVPFFEEALEDGEWPVRSNAVEFLAKLQGKDAVPRIEPLLDDPDGVVRMTVLESLVALSARSSVPAIVKLLESPHEDARGRAAEALGRLGAEEAIPRLRELLGDSSEWARGAAALALADLGDRASGARLRELLSDPSPSVRTDAAVALGGLGLREAIPDLVRAVRDPDDWVWIAAADALGELGAVETAEQVAMARPPAYGEAAFRHALLRLGLREAFEDAEGEVGYPETAFPLNAVRRPMVWRKLEGKSFIRVPGDRLGEALERMAKEADLPLEWPADVEVDRETLWATQWPGTSTPMGAWSRVARRRSSLLAALEVSVRDAGYEAVFEEDRIRLLRAPEAQAFWRRWGNERRNRP